MSLTDSSSDSAQPRNRRLTITMGVLALLFLIIAVAAVFFALAADSTSEPTVVAPSSQHLSLGGSSQTSLNQTPPEVPPWLHALIAGFALIQIGVLLIAALRASKRPLGAHEVRLISFLCEMPMYLGLLGSLLGICLSQFITGSLAAPLAYTTTITGILLFMFAKLTVWPSLPEESLEHLSD